MPTVTLTLPHDRYDVHIGSGLIRDLGTATRAVAAHDRCALLLDAAIATTFGAAGLAALQDAGYAVIERALEAGEQHKHLDTVRRIYDLLLEARMERQSPVIAMGGGVVGDTVGFAAATYLRGVPFIQCPTTLLAMVDASVGGKVGVNVPQGKNLVGSFHQPRLVIIDTNTLADLPARELRCGLAECIKHAMIRDADLFAWIASHRAQILRRDPDTLVELVDRNVRIKADVVMADEKESGVRAHLNFGHTFAHAIEATQHYGADAAGGAAWHHGEAVALGMIGATRLATETGCCDRAVLHGLIDLLQAVGLPVSAPDLADTATLLAAMRLDKKVAGGRIRLVLPRRIGAVDLATDIPDTAIRQAWETMAAP